MRDTTTVPTEIWDSILTGACTDGGFTGRSLALTNKFFHSQSISNRFYSVRLTSLFHLERFLSFLDAQDKECKPKIHHLYLCFMDKIEHIGRPFVDYPLGRGPPRSAADEIRKWDERFVYSMTLLFSLAAPTLRTLCVIAGNPSVLLPAFPYGPLPVLEELAVHHSLHLFFPGEFACKHMWNSNFAFQLPALRRLHMVHHFWSDPSDSRVLTRLAQYNPPNLTHVRISGLSVPPEGFLDDLRRVLGVFHPVPGGGGPQHLGVVPSDAGQLSDPVLPNLRRLIIHGCSPEHRGQCGTINFEWLDLCIEVRRIAQLVKQSRDDDVAVIPLCRPPRRNWRWPDRLFDEWVSRIEGGAGCWVESEDEEAKLEVYEDDHALPEMLEWPLPDSDDDL